MLRIIVSIREVPTEEYLMNVLVALSCQHLIKSLTNLGRSPHKVHYRPIVLLGKQR